MDCDELQHRKEGRGPGGERRRKHHAKGSASTTSTWTALSRQASSSVAASAAETSLRAPAHEVNAHASNVSHCTAFTADAFIVTWITDALVDVGATVSDLSCDGGES